MRRLALFGALICTVAVAAAVGSSEGEGAPVEQVVKVTARKFEFSPSTIQLRAGVPAVIEISSLDRKHGFQVPDLKIDAEIAPDRPTLVHLLPDKPGTYPFHCDVFCGSGHEEMSGVIVVKP